MLSSYLDYDFRVMLFISAIAFKNIASAVPSLKPNSKNIFSELSRI